MRAALSLGIFVEVLAEVPGGHFGSIEPHGQAVLMPAALAEGGPATTGLLKIGDDTVIVDVLAAQERDT